MYRDRIELNELIAKRNNIQLQISKITKSESGKSYGQLIREIVDEVVKSKLPYASKVVRYKEYTRIHREITRSLNIKTQTFTKSEYKEALGFIEKRLGYAVPDCYKCI